MRGQPWSLRHRPGRSIEVVFYLPGQGDREVARSTGTADEREAQVRAGEIWVKEMRRAGEPIPEDAASLARPLVEDAAAEFVVHLERAAAEYRERYVIRYETDLNLYVIQKTDDEIAAAALSNRVAWQPPWRFVDEITSATWEEEKRRLHKSNGGPLGYRSIQHLTNTLRHFLRFCVSEGHLSSAPELLAPPRKLVLKEQRPRRAMPKAERERLLRTLDEYAPHGNAHPLPRGTHRRFYEALFFTLLRRGELWALTRRWLDTREELIRVPPEHSKSGEAEEIPLHQRAKAALLGQIAARGKIDPDVPVFGRINVRKAWEWAVARAKIDRHGLVPHHSTRHSSATELAKKTRDREALKRAGRWRSDASIDPYIHTDVEHARPLMKKL